MKTTADSSSDSSSDDGEMPNILNRNEELSHKLTQARLESQGKYFRFVLFFNNLIIIIYIELIIIINIRVIIITYKSILLLLLIFASSDMTFFNYTAKYLSVLVHMWKIIVIILNRQHLLDIK